MHELRNVLSSWQNLDVNSVVDFGSTFFIERKNLAFYSLDVDPNGKFDKFRGLQNDFI